MRDVCKSSMKYIHISGIVGYETKFTVTAHDILMHHQCMQQFHGADCNMLFTEHIVHSHMEFCPGNMR